MYLLDANVFIEAKNRYYAFDIVPGFWVWLDKAHAGGTVCSIKEVQEELLKHDDELADWVRQRPNLFQTVDQKTTAFYAPLTQWAYSQNFTGAALSVFTATNADYLLIAYAKAHSHTLVTHERFNANVKNRIPIPNACRAMGVKTVDTFQMLRQAGASFRLV